MLVICATTKTAYLSLSMLVSYLLFFPHKNVKSNLMKHSFTRTLKISEQKIIEQQKPSFTNDVCCIICTYIDFVKGTF